MRAVMVQGTASHVGKTTLVTGLARAYVRRGLTVLPFKPQNISNNAAVTVDGGEIGRAQALQALASGVEPHSDMNPVLLKPEDAGVQLVVQGQRLEIPGQTGLAGVKPQLLQAVLDSYRRLCGQADLVLVEGAGSPAEINLRQHDIANMGFARAANVPVVLAGCIERGGVIAQIVGTKAVLDPDDRSMIRAFVINKLHGDTRLFQAGYDEIARRTGWPGLGIVPWFGDAHCLPAEDVQGLPHAAPGDVQIVCPVTPGISNFDDLDPLAQTPGVSVRMIHPGKALPGTADLVVLAGSKSTRSDLDFVRAQGWDVDLWAHVRRGGRVLGLCGGYQMLGRVVSDPDGIEGPAGTTRGLGFLDIETVIAPRKRLARTTGRHVGTGASVQGYEIHMGQTDGPDCARPVVMLGKRPDGAQSADGRVQGLYLHGLFAEDAFRAAFLRDLGTRTGDFAYAATIEATLDALADHLEEHMNLDALLDIARGQ